MGKNVEATQRSWWRGSTMTCNRTACGQEFGLLHLVAVKRRT